MKKLFFLVITLISFVSLAQDRDMIGYKLNGKIVKEKKDAIEFIQELNKLKVDKDYYVEADLCVIYGDLNETAEDNILDLILLSEGFSLELEGIYGESGDHMFEVLSQPEGYFLGVVSGVFECE